MTAHHVTSAFRPSGEYDDRPLTKKDRSALLQKKSELMKFVRSSRLELSKAKDWLNGDYELNHRMLEAEKAIKEIEVRLLKDAKVRDDPKIWKKYKPSAKRCDKGKAK